MAVQGTYADIGYFAELEWDGNTYRVTDEIAIGNFTTDVVETSASNGEHTFKTFIPGMSDAGELTFTINCNPDAVLEADPTVDTVTVTFPKKTGQSAGATFECEAFIVSASVAVPINDRMTQSVSFKLSGKPEFTAGVTGGG